MAATLLFLCVGANREKFSSVQSLSRVRLFVTPWTAAHQASLSITDSWSLLKLMSIKSVMQSIHLILCCPLLLPPSIFPSIRVLSSESVLCIRWPEYQSFSFEHHSFLWVSPVSDWTGLSWCSLCCHVFCLTWPSPQPCEVQRQACLPLFGKWGRWSWVMLSDWSCVAQPESGPWSNNFCFPLYHPSFDWSQSVVAAVKYFCFVSLRI